MVAPDVEIDDGKGKIFVCNLKTTKIIDIAKIGSSSQVNLKMFPALVKRVC